MDYFLLVLIGFAAGTIGSLIGLGGGIVIVPLLISLGGFALHSVSPQTAVGTSIITIVFTGLSSTLTYIKHKRVDYKLGLLLFLGSGPGGVAGSWTNKYLQLQNFSLYFGMFMIFVSLLLLFKSKFKPLPFKESSGIVRTFISSEGEVLPYGFNPAVAIPLSFFVGFLSGLFGIGGGALLVPAMILLFSFPPHVAVATSMFIVFLSSAVSSVTHIFLGNVNWLYALILIPGAWFGGRFGTFLNMKMRGNTIVNVLRITLIVVGIRMIASSFL